jgi:hypothetical protein
MNITTSAHISKFNFKPIWDLSGTVPRLRLVNDSAGVGDVATGTYSYVYVSAQLADDIVLRDIAKQISPGNDNLIAINQAFDRTQDGLADVLEALNSKNAGTWTGTYVNGVLTLMSANNPHIINGLRYTLASDSLTNISMTRTQTPVMVSSLSLCTWWFEAYLPDGTAFHSATLSSPDRNGIWSSYDIAEAIPEIMGHIPWGKPFKVRGYVNDGTTTYGPVDQEVEICRPYGNNLDTQNNYGAGDIFTDLKCNLSPKKLYVEDKTVTTYKAVSGTVVSKLFKLVFPTDDNGDTANSTSNSTASSVLLGIGVDSDCYQLIVETVIDYVFGDSTVRIKYKLKKRLEIFCSLSLCALQCSIKKFEDKLTSGSKCTASDQLLLLLINSKYNRLLSGLLQPDCGVGVPALIEEIKALLPKDCGCN